VQVQALSQVQTAYRQLGPGRATLAGQDYELRWVCPPRVCEAKWQVHVHTGMGTVELSLDAHALFSFWPTPEVQAPPTLLSIHLLEEFAPLTEWFERLFDVPVLGLELQMRSAKHRPCMSLAVTPPGGNEPTLIHVVALPDSLKLIRTLGSPFSEPTHVDGLDEIPLRLRALIGRTRVALSDLRRLEQGDILAVEQWVAEGDQLRVDWELENSPTPRLLAWANNFGITVFDILYDKGPMDSSYYQSHGLDTRSLEDLEVTVVFDLGERTLPLRELQTIRPGYVFPIEATLNKLSVHLRVNGKVIGVGQLVSVGERLGVRVVSIGKEGQSGRVS